MKNAFSHTRTRRIVLTRLIYLFIYNVDHKSFIWKKQNETGIVFQKSYPRRVDIEGVLVQVDS